MVHELLLSLFLLSDASTVVITIIDKKCLEYYKSGGGLGPIESKSTMQQVEQNQIKEKKINKTRKKNSKKTYNNGHWTHKEHKLYMQFIEKNKEIMMKSDMKKQEKIFKQMSLIIKSRSPSQCRSHHQKFNPF